MSHWTGALIALLFLVFALGSRKISHSVLTGPMLFAAFGILIGPQLLGWIELEISNHVIHTIAEVTLVVVLFTDAASTDFKAFRASGKLPLRMLLIGMPLAVGLGTVAALALFPGWLLWEAALLAAILTPTDAALGQSVIENESVPDRIGTAIGSESGLNDGLALPLVILFAALASGGTGDGAAYWTKFIGSQILLGPLAGIVTGFAGGRLVSLADERNWMSEWAEGIAAMAIALGAYMLAEAMGGNGFLAVFSGGLAFGKGLRRRCLFLHQFEQTEAHMLVLITFTLVGAMLLPAAMQHFTWPCLLFAIFALTIMRMLPIAISLIGLKLGLHTIAFLGWFGPRGLASVLILLIVMQSTDLVRESELLAAVALTVTLSIILHGVTAAPWARIYGRRADNNTTKPAKP
ncbi:MAG: cation:proton antiporter [Gammaproteobacteria bacterium]|nr:cation:proton antiporter [Gammaproteobacteria bacterium]